MSDDSSMVLFCQIFSIVRDEENPQLFSIEYVRGAIRTYSSTERDALIASVLDGVRASGNRDVCVKMTFTDRGKRLGMLRKDNSIMLSIFKVNTCRSIHKGGG